MPRANAVFDAFKNRLTGFILETSSIYEACYHHKELYDKLMNHTKKPITKIATFVQFLAVAGRSGGVSREQMRGLLLELVEGLLDAVYPKEE